MLNHKSRNRKLLGYPGAAFILCGPLPAFVWQLRRLGAWGPAGRAFFLACLGSAAGGRSRTNC